MEDAQRLLLPLFPDDSEEAIGMDETARTELARKRKEEIRRVREELQHRSDLTLPLLALAEDYASKQVDETGIVLEVLGLRSGLTEAEVAFVRGLILGALDRTPPGIYGIEVVRGGCAVLAAHPARKDELLALRILDWRTQGPDFPGLRRDPKMDRAAALLLTKIGGADSIGPLKSAFDYWEPSTRQSGPGQERYQEVASILADALKAVQTRVSSKVDPAKSQGTDTQFQSTGSRTDTAARSGLDHPTPAVNPWLLSTLAFLFLLAAGWGLRSWKAGKPSQAPRRGK